MGDRCEKTIKDFAKCIKILQKDIITYEVRVANADTDREAVETSMDKLISDIEDGKRKLAKKLLFLNRFAYRCKLPPVLDGAERMDFDRIADICLSFLDNNERRSKEEAFLAEKDKENAKKKSVK
jgi:hypothetical protein